MICQKKRKIRYTSLMNLVQPILVVPSNPKNYVIRDVALASVCSMQKLSHENWDLWLTTAFTKSVRKVKNIEMLQKMCEEENFVQMGCAAARYPDSYENYSKKLSKTRVSGWDTEVLPETTEDTVYTHVIYLNASLEMSTGKSAAQAAHALMKYCLENPQVDVSAISLGIRSIPQEEMQMDSAYLIVDNGLTEIPQGSVTAFLSENMFS